MGLVVAGAVGLTTEAQTSADDLSALPETSTVVVPVEEAYDREKVVNNIRFLLCRVYADMEPELDGPAPIRLLNAPPGDE